MRTALRAPALQIATNAIGKQAAVVVDKVATAEGNFGYDAYNVRLHVTLRN